MKLSQITVAVDGKEHQLFKRRLKYRERTRLAGILHDGNTPRAKLDEHGEPVLNEAGEPVMIFSIPVERIGNYRLELIRVSLCNEAGVPFFTADEIDEWETADIDRIVDQIEKDNNTADNAVETVKGNSEPTASADTSSVSA